ARAAQVFGLDHVMILSPEGVPLAAVSRDSVLPTGHAELVQRLAAGQPTWVADLHPDLDGHRVYEIAMQVPGASFAGRVPVLIAAADAEERLIPLLNEWPGLGSPAYPFLVRPQANQIRYLTPPDQAPRAAPGPSVAMSEVPARPAA